MGMKSNVRIREAAASDHGSFVRLFPELAVPDPILDEEQFTRTLVPTTLIAESLHDGSVAGYAYFQIMKGATYVRHLVTAPESRRTGVGRALLGAIAERARAAHCSTWCLNVKPDNAAAIALYSSLGMAPAHTSRALDMTWSAIDGAARPAHAPVTAREIAPEHDARVERAMQLVDGQLVSTRSTSGRVLMMLEDEQDQVVGISIFHPDFPGAYPFRVARPELALTLLRALQPHARPGDASVGVVTENQPDVAGALLAAGATLKLDILHMKGALPPA